MCVWVHRWSLCPVHREPGHYFQSPSTTGLKAKQPWLSRKHNQLASPELLYALGLSAPKDFVFVHHQVVSKRRCASWGTRYCNEAPREIQTQLFDTPCSECTGEDRCDSLNVPYSSYVSGHRRLSPEQDKRLDDAVAEYWRCEMLAKIAQLSEFIPHFYNHGADSGKLNPNSTSFFQDFVCVEDPQHIHAIRGETSDCEWCSNIISAPAHNLTRAIRRQEVLTVLQNDFGGLLDQFDLLNSDEQLSNFRHLQGQDRTPQDWCPPLPQCDRVNAWHFQLARIGDRLIQKGPDWGFTPFLRPLDNYKAWCQTIEDRISLAKHVATELSQDPGLSEVFLDKLFGHIASLLCPEVEPKPNRETSDLPELRDPCHPITALMVNSFDFFVGEYREEILDAFMRSIDLTRDLSLYRDTAITNSKFAALSIQADIKDCTIDVATARCSEGSCSICMEDWLNADDIPNHLSIVALPCCKKPTHGRCLKPLLRIRARKPTCPLCRASLVESGWFGSVFQGNIQSDEIVEEGFIPFVMPGDGDSDQDSIFEGMAMLIEGREVDGENQVTSDEESEEEELIDRRVKRPADDGEEDDSARPSKRRRTDSGKGEGDEGKRGCSTM